MKYPAAFAQPGPLLWGPRARPAVPALPGHAPAAMSARAAERRLLPRVRGVARALGAAALTGAAGTAAPRVRFPGAAASPRSPAAPRRERPGAARPRSAPRSARRGRRLPAESAESRPDARPPSRAAPGSVPHPRPRAHPLRCGSGSARSLGLAAPGRHGAAVAGLAAELGGDAAVRGARAAARHPPVPPHLPRPARPPQGRAQVGRRGG